MTTEKIGDANFGVDWSEYVNDDRSLTEKGKEMVEKSLKSLYDEHGNAMEALAEK